MLVRNHFYPSLRSHTRSRALDIAVPFTVEPAWRHVDALVHCAGPDEATAEAYRLVYVKVSGMPLPPLHQGKCSLRAAHPFTLKPTAHGLMKPVKRDPIEKLAGYCWRLRRLR